MRARLLIVEDDPRLGQLLVEFLSQHDFEVHLEPHGDRALARVEALAPDALILDLMLPGMSGLEICQALQGKYEGGILMLTAVKGTATQIEGLNLGADDYVIKPVNPHVLLARLRSLLRRLDREASPDDGDAKILEVGLMRLSKEAQRVTVDGEEVELTGMEFKLLWLLALHAGEPVTRELLYTEGLEVRYDGLDRGVDVHISRIRRKLKATRFEPKDLRAIRNVGYLLVKR